MAEETKTNETELNETTKTEGTESKETPTVEEIMEQLAKANAERDKANAERDKYKSANDKLSKEAAEAKRKERARMTAEEQEAEAKAEAERARNEELENLRKELNHQNAVAAYKSIPDESMIESLIDAVSDADHSAIAGIMDKYASAKVKEAQAEWQKSRPRVNVGVGDGSLTKEQFNNMSMAEKSKLYRENQAEYDRLNG